MTDERQAGTPEPEELTTEKENPAASDTISDDDVPGAAASTEAEAHDAAPDSDTPDIDAADSDAPSEEEEKAAASARRGNMLWLLGGIYLMYTGYTLCKGFLQGDETSSIPFFLSGIAFLALGGFLAIRGGLDLSRESRENQGQRGGLFGAAMAASQEPKKEKLSISQRARLANSDGETAGEDDGETGEGSDEE